MTVRECRDGDAHLGPGGTDLTESNGSARRNGCVLRALGLHPVNELNELRRRAEIAEKVISFDRAARRIPSHRKKARHPRVEELPHQAISLVVRGPNAGQVSHRLHAGVLEDVPQHVQRTLAGGTARTIGHGDEVGARRGEFPDRLRQ